MLKIFGRIFPYICSFKCLTGSYAIWKVFENLIKGMCLYPEKTRAYVYTKSQTMSGNSKDS